MHKVALARYCFRDLNSDPKLVCLFPFVSDEFECLYLNQLPFSEDSRNNTLIFPSLPLPNPSQLHTIDLLINKLNLMDDEKEDLLPVHNIPNPTIYRLNATIQLRHDDNGGGGDGIADLPDDLYNALHPNLWSNNTSVCQETDDEQQHEEDLLVIKKQAIDNTPSQGQDSASSPILTTVLTLGDTSSSSYPSTAVRGSSSSSSSLSSSFEGSFEMKERPSSEYDLNEKKRKLWREVVKTNILGPTIEPVNVDALLTNSKTEGEPKKKQKQQSANSIAVTISAEDPIGDFNKYITDHANDENIVPTAIKQMILYIYKLLESSDTSIIVAHKAVECLIALRTASIKTDHSEIYNEFIKSLLEAKSVKNRKFWRKLYNELNELQINEILIQNDETSKKESLHYTQLIQQKANS